MQLALLRNQFAEGLLTRVGILYGGCSTEHEVSLRSAATVAQHLDRSQFTVLPIFIDKQGRWLQDSRSLCAVEEAIPLATTGPTLQAVGFDRWPIALDCDVIFSLVHGRQGEDGTIQGLLELCDIPYVGAGVLASAIGINKWMAKRLVADSQVAVVPFMVIKAVHWYQHIAHYAQQVQQTLSYPVFVKPVNTGSSIGISRVDDPAHLAKAVEDALQYDHQVLIEKALVAREIEVAVLENLNEADPPLVSIAGEILPNQAKHQFYSYAAKYLDEKGADFHIPANLSPDQLKQVQLLASKVFIDLGCAGMARVDFFLEKNTQQFYFNEINTLPGFTAISMYPKLWEMSGMHLSTLLTQLIMLAMARHKKSKQLTVCF